MILEALDDGAGSKEYAIEWDFRTPRRGLELRGMLECKTCMEWNALKEFFILTPLWTTLGD